MSGPAVQVWPGVVVVSGVELLSVAAAVVAHGAKRRKHLNQPVGELERLAAALRMAAASAGGHPECIAVESFPTVPLKQAAQRLGVSERQARRMAPKLGGERIGRNWFVDEHALAEHLGGRDG